MANVFTAIEPVLYSAAQVVSRELVGVASSVDTNFNDKMVAEGDSVKVPVTPSLSTSSYSAAMTTTAGTAQTVTSVSLTMDQHKQVPWQLGAEEERSLLNGDGNAAEFMRQSTAQAIRAVINEMESYVAGIAYKGASRGVGTLGTAPFASNIDIAADLRKILDDNGAPKQDRSLVINTTAGANLRKQITIVNDAGSDAENMVRNGEMINLYGFSTKESAGIASHTAGTGTGYLSNLSGGYAIGSTTIAADTGSGTILAGDAVTFGTSAASPIYIVNTALSGGSLAIGRPGLQAAIANNAPINVQGAYTANIGLHRNAVVVAARAPEQVDNANIQSRLIVDPVTGLPLLFERIAGDGMSTYRVRLLYAAAAVQPEHIAVLFG